MGSRKSLVYQELGPPEFSIDPNQLCKPQLPQAAKELAFVTKRPLHCNRSAMEICTSRFTEHWLAGLSACRNTPSRKTFQQPPRAFHEKQDLEPCSVCSPSSCSPSVGPALQALALPILRRSMLTPSPRYLAPQGQVLCSHLGNALAQDFMLARISTSQTRPYRKVRCSCAVLLAATTFGSPARTGRAEIHDPKLQVINPSHWTGG